jgi:hypothetical protein
MNSGRCALVSLPELKKSARLVVKSKLIMARPIIFKTNELIINVFHG